MSTIDWVEMFMERFVFISIADQADADTDTFVYFVAGTQSSDQI